MSKKSFYLVSSILVLSLVLTNTSEAELVGWWRLDETSGTTANDSSGNENHGTTNGDPQWEAGKIGGALHLDGSSDYVQIPFSESLRVFNRGDFTLTTWFKTDEIDKKQIIFQQGNLNGPGRSWLTIGESTNDNVIRSYVGGAWTSSGIIVEAEEWYHAAVVVTEGGGNDSIQMYVNGEPAGNPRQDSMEDCEGVFLVGCGKGIDTFMDGAVDDIRIYSRALTEDDLKIIMEGIEGGFPLAIDPTPEDGSQYEETWTRLSWRAGDFAVSHDLYFGTDFDYVNEGAEGAFVGNTTATFQVVGFPGFPAPEGLQPGTTYYWRVDEVNDLHPDSPWKGEVWSFWIPPKSAYNAIPADGEVFADPNVDLSWTLGLKAVMSAMYFGVDAEEVANGAGAPPVIEEGTFDPGPLALDTTYYWRVDIFDGMQWTRGEVWSFTTLPDVSITDSSLTVWWTLDEGSASTTAVDWSGHGHHGTLINDPQWVDAYHGGGLRFDGVDDFVLHSLPQGQNFASFTVALWARAATLGQEQNMSLFSSHTPNSSGFQIDVDGTNPGNYRTNPPGGTTQLFGPVTTDWIHLALVGEGTTVLYYYNGSWFTSGTLTDNNLLFNEFIIGASRNRLNCFDGTIDDLRVYNRALTQAEIQEAMRGDPLLAWGPKPSPASTLYIRDATPFSWSPGDNASQHDVYFGTDRDAVADADASDATGIYQGRQGVTIYTPAEGVEWGGGPYYWRVDEYNTDATISKGYVWSFTVTDYIGIDDFEDYNDYPPDEIFSTWIDGYGTTTNGSTAGYAEPDFLAGEHYVETTIVHGGGQSMPLFYDNNFKYSEATMTLVSPRDWTAEGVGVLSLWFRGDASNAAERMYVALNGSATVYHDNPDAALINEWTQWTIDLQEFAAKGVNLANVNTISIGFGDKNNLQVGGSGMVFFDDIRLYRPAP